ncbi:unnamed protein product [Bursaphelenchus xylophilus]|uniref:(pine wood nematode) hypothetical protein n=1 Tax=Bursaphelenchus xylophilus TaxID=6326 RepID=A0A1I7S5P5_BURXY|nr:unnamed protein product [Bursaphelenchus xylophilus]CAG9124934.1 unnamed protein product [Bursaphelenchus xylophilus]
MSPLFIHNMLEQNKFIRYVESLPVKNDTKNTMMMVARIRKQLPESDDYNTTTFLSYIAHFDRYYPDERDAMYKFTTIRTSMNEIKSLQKENPEAVFGLTKFSDMTTKQFVATRTCGGKFNPLSHFGVGKDSKTFKMAPPKRRCPDSFDWRRQGKVTPVKDQGQCGACYAFAAVAAVESQHAIKTGRKVRLSEQEAISCTYLSLWYGFNLGCYGGHSDGVLNYIKYYGIGSERDFPSVSSVNQSVPWCQRKKRVARISRQERLIPGDEENMKNVLRNVGPVVTYIDAEPLKNYKRGIVRSSGRAVNHAVLTVGYGRNHWIIKNSWGKNWGEDGYFGVARGRNALKMDEFNFAAFK